MPRKMDLRRTRQSFVDVLDNGAAVWETSASAPRERRKTAAEDIFLRFVVGWETFVSEWFIGCVNRDATRYRRTIEQRMNNWLQAEAQKQYPRYKATFPPPTLSLKRHPNLEEVRELLDPREGNIEFRTFSELAERANQELAPRYANRTSTLINAGADEIVDAALDVRNALAHRSRRAVREMNQRARPPRTSTTGAPPGNKARTAPHRPPCRGRAHCVGPLSRSRDSRPRSTCAA